MGNFKPSEYQQRIFDWIDGDHKNLVVEAYAGSGKTTTLVQSLSHIDHSKEVLFASFNRHIADDLKTKVPSNVMAETYHTVGYRNLQAKFGKITVNKYKVNNIMRNEFPDYASTYTDSIAKLVSLMKANMVNYDDFESMLAIIEKHEIEDNGDPATLCKLASAVIPYCIRDTSTIDFDDMCWLPIVLDIEFKKYDVVFIDEAQDTNKSQIALALKSVKPDGRIIAVGDRRQSIYGFRGADVDAIPNLISSLHADILPLSICYRCSKAVIKEVKRIFPDLDIEVSPYAPAGEFDPKNSYKDFLAEVLPGDMVLCRTNAPLIEPVFYLLKHGIKATIRGRDIGSNLNKIIEKSGATSLKDLRECVEEYKKKEIVKYEAKNQKMAIENLEDKISCIYSISKECGTLYDLTSKINVMFSDDTPGILFSSIHKAKGLEANTVWILDREKLMPHPKATAEWEKLQENNIIYVAFTRAKENLKFVKLES